MGRDGRSDAAAEHRSDGVHLPREREGHAEEVADVHVWYRPTDALEAEAIAAGRATLSHDELARADRFHFDRDRRDFTIAHELIRRSLSRYSSLKPADWTFGAGAHGKPFVSLSSAVPADEPGHRLSFNIAHTHGFVACAVTIDAPVGIDVERTDRLTDFDALAARFFSPSEVAAMKERDDQARRVRFFELWTLKEAILKATGKGLSEPLRSMTFEFDPDATIRFIPAGGIDPAEWTFSLYSPMPTVRMAVAINRPRKNVRIHCHEDDDS